MMSDKTTAKAALIDYLFSDGYRHLLRRAIAASLATSQVHTEAHIKALDLVDAAFPELAEIRRNRS
jgi:hypothetical protein